MEQETAVDMDEWNESSEYGCLEHFQAVALPKDDGPSARVSVHRFDVGERAMFRVSGRYFMPADQLGRPENRHWRQLADAGDLVATLGNIHDYDAIRHSALTAHGESATVALAYDPWEAMSLIQDLKDAGVPVLAIQQTASFRAEALGTLRGLLCAGYLVHDGNPVLTMSLSGEVANSSGPLGALLRAISSAASQRAVAA